MLLLKIFIILLLLFLPFGEILRFNIDNNIFLKPLDVVAVLIAIIVCSNYLRNKSFRIAFSWYYFLFPSIGFISLLLNSYWLKPTELFVSFLYLIRWISYLSLFFAIGQVDKKFRKKIEVFLLVDGIIVLFIGYIQFFFYPSLRNLFYLGWDEHLYRMFSSFFDPNFVGAFFVLYLIFIICLFWCNKRKSRNFVLFYSLLSTITLFAIFLTYSRSALLMLITSGIAFFSLIQRKKFILLLLGAILAFVLIISPYFYIENLDLFRTNSSLARLTTTQHALQIIQSHPLIGVGFDSYRYVQIRYHFTKEATDFPANSAAGVDTSLLFVCATTGIMGFISYCYMWFRLFILARSKLRIQEDYYAVIFITSSVGLFINALFINSLFYAEIMAWMWIIAGMMREY